MEKPVELSWTQIFQACASSSMRKRSSAAITRETLTSFIPSGATMTSDSVRQGDQIAGLDVLKRTTLGTPKAAATCAGPLSLPIKPAAFESNAAASDNGPCTTACPLKGEASSPGPARKTGVIFHRSKYRATSQ